MNNHLHFALQSAQWACGSILDAEFYLTHMDRADRLTPISTARERLMDALDHLSAYEREIRESGPRPAGEPGANIAPQPAASGPVGRGLDNEGDLPGAGLK